MPIVNHDTRRLAALIESRYEGRWRISNLLDWMVQDVLADLTGRTPDYPKEAMSIIAELSSEYARVVCQSPPFDDILGSLYMLLAKGRIKDKSMGQYFTPSNVCDLMAAMSLAEPLPTEYVERVMEPCAGSGGMLLALCRQVYKQDPEKLVYYSFTGIDLDPICAHMTATQMLANAFIHGVSFAELFIYQGNALANPDALDLVCGAICTTLPAEYNWPEPERRKAVVKAVSETRRSVLEF